eukprot:153355_1
MFECRSCFQMKPEPSSWRGNELWCSRCILVDGLDKEHDRTPPSRSAGSGRFFGQCGSCSKDVCGKAIKTKSAVFHTKCFVCAKCDQSLVGKGHVTQPDGRPFCKSCNTNATMTSANGVRYMPGKVVTYIDGLRVDHVGKVRRIHDSTGLVAVVNGDINSAQTQSGVDREFGRFESFSADIAHQNYAIAPASPPRKHRAPLTPANTDVQDTPRRAPLTPANTDVQGEEQEAGRQCPPPPPPEALARRVSELMLAPRTRNIFCAECGVRFEGDQNFCGSCGMQRD